MRNTVALRRKDRELNSALAMRILENAEVGYLSLACENQPYTIPVNYVLWDGRIYIHTAKEGKKINWLQKNPQICFTVSTMIDVKKADTYCGYGAYFESVVVEGHGRVLQQHPNKREILTALVKKYDAHAQLPPIDEAGENSVWLIEVTLDSLCGKGRYPVQS